MIALNIELLNDWNETIKIKDQWDKLNLQSGIIHPFTIYEYFDCWYRAYCKPGEARIILMRDGQNLRAIFPGIVSKEKFKGIPITYLSYAANWESTRADIIATTEYKETFLLNLEAISSQLPEKIHLIKLWMVQSESPADRLIKASELPLFSPYNANRIESPGFDLFNGWDNYFQGRSKKFRFRFRQAEKRAKALGSLGFEVFSSPEELQLIIPRLKSLDAKTWQHKNNSGLFSTIDNGTFYQGLLLKYSRIVKVIIAFLTIGELDVAYELGVICGTKAFFLKYGYDPEFSDCRPGVLVQSYLTRHVSSLGIQEIDLGMEQSEEKAHWQIETPEFNNYWLIRKNTLRGSLLLTGIAINDVIKKIKIIKKRESGSVMND